MTASTKSMKIHANKMAFVASVLEKQPELSIFAVIKEVKRHYGSGISGNCVSNYRHSIKHLAETGKNDPTEESDRHEPLTVKTASLGMLELMHEEGYSELRIIIEPGKAPTLELTLAEPTRIKVNLA